MVSTRYSLAAVAPCTPLVAWEFISSHDPSRYYPAFGPLPAVTAVSGQSGDWRTPGQSRTLQLSDGGHVVERITDADSPTFFAYDLTDFQKLFGRLVSGARAEWRCDAGVEGTRITWTYEFHPKRGRRWIVEIIVRLAWAPYMRRVLPTIVAHLPAATPSA